jgi:hypothetical protein
MKALERGDWSTSRPGCFTPGNEPLYQFNSGLDEPKNRSGSFGKEENFLPLPGFEPQTVQSGSSKITMLHKFRAGEDVKLEKRFKNFKTQTSKHYQYRMCQL